ncbi:MAG: hypothetical protein H7321_03185 [Bacteroidia bacterium]|nr:hypothetical protein [Bacteroidia bacterium]
MRFCFLAILFITSFYSAFAQKDTAVEKSASNDGGYRIKGIDLSFGNSYYAFSENDIKKLTSRIVNDRNDYYKINNRHISGTDDNLSRISAGFVISPVKSSSHKFFYHPEIRIGLEYAYSARYSNGLYSDTIIDKSTGEVLQNSISYSSRLHTECFYAAFVVNTNPFFKHFAAFGGIGGNVGITQWNVNSSNRNAFYTESSTIPNQSTKSSSAIIPVENFSTATAAFYIPAGIKYNFSCELNFFFETRQGLNIYSSGLEHNFKVNYCGTFCLGLRIKLIDDQDKQDHKTTIFW